MAPPVLTYSGVTYDNPAAGSTTFPLTTSGGLVIGYLSPSHIHVYSAAVGSDNETELTRPSQWDFDPTDTSIVLKTPVSGSVSIRIRRITPHDRRFTIFQKGTLLTADQLNASANFNLYVIQEYYDNVEGGGGGDSTLALARATEALARANDAMIASGDAITTAYDAASTANAVSSTASSAQTTANNASQTASSADTKATSALSQIGTVDTKAANALNKAEAALAAVADASVFVPVANVAAIPSSPTSSNARIEVRDSTGIQNRVPAIINLPSGFVGSNELFVRMDWTGTAWRYDRFGALDPETRYVKNPLPVASTSVAGIVQLVNTTNDASTNKAATAAAVKSAYDAAQTASTNASSAVSTANSAQATANNALPKSGGAMAGPIVFAGTQEKAAANGTYGLTTLSSAIDSTSESVAATSKAVKDAIDAARSSGGLPSTGGTLTGNLNVPSLNDGQLGGFRNRVINGGMRISQRYGAPSHIINNGSSAYSTDRWKVFASGSAVTAQRISHNSQTQGNSLRITGGAGNTLVAITQDIERDNSFDLAGGKVTLSFAAMCSVSRTLEIRVKYVSGSTDNAFGSATETLYQTRTLTTGFVDYSFTFDMPVAATRGVVVDFRILNHTSGNFDITKVQLEKGSVATTFERRSPGIELSMCQRYFYKTGVQVFLTSSFSANSSSAGKVFAYVQFPVTMFAAPVVSLLSATGGVFVEDSQMVGFRAVHETPAQNTYYSFAGYEANAELS